MDALLKAIQEMKEEVTDRLDKIEKRLNSTFEQTCSLTEFRTETNSTLKEINNKLDNITDDIKKTNNKTNLALNNAAQNRLDIANIKEN